MRLLIVAFLVWPFLVVAQEGDTLEATISWTMPDDFDHRGFMFHAVLDITGPNNNPPRLRRRVNIEGSKRSVDYVVNGIATYPANSTVNGKVKTCVAGSTSLGPVPRAPETECSEYKGLALELGDLVGPGTIELIVPEGVNVIIRRR